MVAPKRMTAIFAMALLGMSAFCGHTFVRSQDGSQAPAPYVAEQPVMRGLDASLFMQSSAEYRACCYQAYNLAIFKLRLACKDKQQGQELAVVMDLDETVLDNSGFQAQQVRGGVAFDQRLWEIWEQKHSQFIGLTPGARDFIWEAEKLGVKIFYISNRSENSREPLKEALKRLEINLPSDKHLLPAKETSNKTLRRQAVEKDHKVILYVGDNLRDFDERFKCADMTPKEKPQIDAAIKARKDQVDQARAEFGEKWIILPNTCYGEWMKPMGRGLKDLDQLTPQAK